MEETCCFAKQQEIWVWGLDHGLKDCFDCFQTPGYCILKGWVWNRQLTGAQCLSCWLPAFSITTVRTHWQWKTGFHNQGQFDWVSPSFPFPWKRPVVALSSKFLSTCFLLENHTRPPLPHHFLENESGNIKYFFLEIHHKLTILLIFDIWSLSSDIDPLLW